MDLSGYLSHEQPNIQQQQYGYSPQAQYASIPSNFVAGYTQFMDPYAQAGQPQAQQNLWSTAHSTTYQQNPQPVAAMYGGGRRFKGTVKSFSHTNGYGFVSSQEIMDAFCRDVFINQIEVDKMTGLDKAPVSCGTLLSFTVVPNKRGQPQGRELRMENAMSQASLAQMAALQAAQMGFGTSGMGVYNAALMQQQQASIDLSSTTILGPLPSMGLPNEYQPLTANTPDAQQLAALQKFTSEVNRFEQDDRARAAEQDHYGTVARDRSRSPPR